MSGPYKHHGPVPGVFIEGTGFLSEREALIANAVHFAALGEVEWSLRTIERNADETQFEEGYEAGYEIVTREILLLIEALKTAAWRSSRATDREVRADAARHVSRERGHRVTFERIDYRRWVRA